MRAGGDRSGYPSAGVVPGFWAKAASRDVTHESPERGPGQSPEVPAASASEEMDSPGTREGFFLFHTHCCVRTVAVSGFW